MKWSFTIWLMTNAPKGVQVPISPNTAIFTSSSVCTFRGGDLKYLVLENTLVSASPTRQQYLLRGSRPLMTARYILPWKPRWPTLQVIHVPSTTPFSSPGSLPYSTMGLLQNQGVETHMTCISPSMLVSPMWICFGPDLVVTLTCETCMSQLRVTLELKSASKNWKMGWMSSSVIWCYDSMSWKQSVNSCMVACPSLLASQVDSQKACRLVRDTSALSRVVRRRKVRISGSRICDKYMALIKSGAFEATTKAKGEMAHLTSMGTEGIRRNQCQCWAPAG